MIRLPILAVLLLLGGSGTVRPQEPAPPPVDFDRDIRPIFSDTCYACHGPDKKKRKGGVRLDTREGVFKDREGTRAIVPGDLAKSELYRRLTTDDEDDRMPPAKSGARLSKEKIALVRRWIEQGARWTKHWAFVRPERPPLARTKNRGWVRNEIDAFVLSRLEREGLTPSPAADRTTLIRRVTLDLTGLPPTPEEVDAFVADGSPRAYEKGVDRLLASSRYGERMAVRWLDAARYADTSGYQNDGRRSMWRWRDWVIDAYNANMPFDRFTIEQLAGDLLPNPTLDQRIATAFNRNHRGNSEGGIIPEEYQVEYVVDRVDTTATVWLGLTIGCARCHEHKYDPIPQEEFYRMFAYFNTIPENGRAVKEGNSPPFIKAPTAKQREQLRRLDTDLAAAHRAVAALEPGLTWSAAAWRPAVAERWTVRKGLAARYALDGDPGEAKPVGGMPVWSEGRIGRAAAFDGRRHLEAGDVGKFGYFDKFSLAAWVRPSKLTGTVLSRMKNTARADGYQVHLEGGRVQVNLVKRWLDDSIRVETVRRLEPERWHHIAVTYDGSPVARGIAVYVDGRREDLRVNHDFLNQTFVTDEPFRIGAGNGGRFEGRIDDVHVFARRLSAEEVGRLATPESIREIASRPAAERSPAQVRKLRAAFLERGAPLHVREAHRSWDALLDRREAFIESIPLLMVMEEMETPRKTRILDRGRYDRPGKEVAPGVPATLHPLPEGAPADRLGFARWLMDPANPLTARVVVNRWWQMYFGAGLVRTIEDFGSQGERPSHPKLLDWLAAEFVSSGWDVKHLQKKIVMSATYRQSSRLTPERLERDPANRLLARGPRFRLPAEAVRDQALYVAGLLVEKIGGPSVKPYQPDGLWREIASDKVYRQSKGPDLYRRSLYTYFKRTVAPPTMSTFDAPGREACTVRQTRTNTPLQALALLNDVTYVEAARGLAARMMTERKSERDRIRRGFRRVVARPPVAREEEVLLAALRRNLARYRDDRAAAHRLISVGDSKPDPNLDPAELAAYTTVASLILNLDEAITKE